MLRSRESLLDARRNDSRPVFSAADGGGAVVDGADGSVAGTASSAASAWPPAQRATASSSSAGIAAAMTSTTIGPLPRQRPRDHPGSATPPVAGVSVEVTEGGDRPLATG